MGKTTGFKEFRRSLPVVKRAGERVGDWAEFHSPMPVDQLAEQGSRCMNCGIPFCHAGKVESGVTVGCPLHNLIPEWNDLVYRGQWHEAYQRLAQTNNFPEFTGRVCPAPCENSCVLGINEEPVMIKEIELAIIDRAFDEGFVTERTPQIRSGKRVAVVGSGPAGLACADDLNKVGHQITVFERSDRVGGLLMYGIPNMKLDKAVVDHRVELLAGGGIAFRTRTEVGIDISSEELLRDHDAVVWCAGAPQPRDIAIDGRDLSGVHFAMEFLTANTKHLLDDAEGSRVFDVRGKDVIVIGGGDTGTDCIASSLRLGCRSVTQFEIMPRPHDRVLDHDHWLAAVRTFQTDYGQEEAIEIFGSDPRQFEITTKRFVGGADGQLTGLETMQVEWVIDGSTRSMREIDGTARVWPADIVFLAMGFKGAERSAGLVEMGVEFDARGNISANAAKQTSNPAVFAAGDCERGQSLIVWAIADGKQAARGVDAYLNGRLDPAHSS